MTDKRIVLVQTKGSSKGLWRILGTMSQLKDSLKVEELPTMLFDVTFSDHNSPCSLVTIKERYVLYREVIEPQSYGSMNPSQL